MFQKALLRPLGKLTEIRIPEFVAVIRIIGPDVHRLDLLRSHPRLTRWHTRHRLDCRYGPNRIPSTK